MTESRIMESINTAKKIINDLMESDAIFYDRTEGNELSGRFNVQMTFAESICYRPQYTAVSYTHLDVYKRQLLLFDVYVNLCHIHDRYCYVILMHH